MGAEHSRVLSTRDVGGASNNQTEAATPPASWKHLAFGFQYNATDLAVWPQCAPLVLWFTEQDALALHARLLRRARTRFLSRDEFRAWLAVDDEGAAASLLRRGAAYGLPSAPNDIMMPPAVLFQKSPLTPHKSTSVPLLDRQVDHVFATFARGGGDALFAMEFLAAMVLGSRAIWRADDKCRVLLALFQDPAASSNAKEPTFKEADLAQLFLCAMHGVGQLTVGVRALWRRHGLELSLLARRLAADAVAFAERQKIVPGARGAKRAVVTATDVRAFVHATPALRRFLALFSGEEMRNPFTFGVARSPCDGLFFSPAYRGLQDHQRRQYEARLAQVVSFEGRLARRRESAATLIQTTWRRRCSRGLLERRRAAQTRQRHASAALLQSFVRRRHFAKVLEQHAEAEANALNGGLFLCGQGPCVPCSSDESLSSSSPSPLRLVDAFKLLRAKLCDVALSRTCALALQSDRQTLFAWGHCLPRVYLDPLGAQASLVDDARALRAAVTLTRASPARLAFRFPSHARVAQLACGLRHALAVTEDGNVHSWGFNDHGQLGHGTGATLRARSGGTLSYARYDDPRDGRAYEFLAQPTKLVYFQGAPQQQAEPIPVARVACGDYYSLALSRDGDVFSWGEGSEGQLGHGDAHARFEVAFVDRQMLNSAYTFLPEPEPVLALSDRRVVQVACRKNHSVALTADGRVFEWGNWGKRLGRDAEHAFEPIETDPRAVMPLRLRQLSVGDHHVLAEGSSVWLRLPGRADGLSAARRVYLACAPRWSCDQEVVAQAYAPRRWSCVILDCDLDDIESETVDGDEEVTETDPASNGDASREEDAQLEAAPASAATDLWARRVAPFRLRTPQQVATFDAKFAHVLGCFRSLGRRFTLEEMLTLWFHGHVTDRLVVLPRGKPPGVYLQLLLPRDEELPTDAPPLMVEFPVVAATSARDKPSKRGFATHLFHATMRERLAALPRRVRKVMPTDFLEPNSIFLVEFNERCCGPEPVGGDDEWGDALGDNDNEHDARSSRFFTRSAMPDGRHMVEWSELVVDAMTRRVLAAQEGGALAVLVVLDLRGADAFELQLPEGAGVYVPVFMVTRTTLATRVPSTGRWGDETPDLTLGEVLDQLVEAQAFDESGDLDEPPAVPPAWMARCFERVDTKRARVQSALASGAAGVVLVQDAQSVEVDGETRGAPVFLEAPPQLESPTDKLIAMVSHADGALLRAASRLAATDSALPFVPSESPCELLVDDAAVEIRPGGTVYAWGNAQNGRLGLGDPTSDSGVLQDGYEALTDSAYRFVDRPTPVVALAGHEMAQLVCGAAHNVAVTTDGGVFTWGKGARGELANARTKEQARRLARDQWVPRVLHHLRYERIVAAAANDAAAALLSELVDPDVYAARRKEITQLRHAARKSLGAT